MRILLQHSKNKAYLADGALWTHQVAQARTFNSTLEAIHFCQATLLYQVDIVLKFDEERYDLHLPLKTSAKPKDGIPMANLIPKAISSLPSQRQ